ncbi:MAG: glycosyltransferase family 39 protein [Patescibacteria group bacterium]
MTNFFQKNKSTSILGIASLLFLFFFFILITPLKTPTNLEPRFDWPDSTANYFWVKEFATHNKLSLSEPLNLEADNLIHPRSFNVNSRGELVPGSFLGLILIFGGLAKLFSVKAIIYFTPVLAVSAAWALYLIIRKLFNSEKVALWSALLLLINPAWDYYTYESLLPNVPFVSIFLWSVWALLSIKKEKLITWFSAGLISGLALSIRPSEIIWVTIIYVALLINQKNIKPNKGWLLLILGGVIALLPSLYEQKIIYGQVLNVGYNQLASLTEPGLQLKSLIKQLIIPFGFSPGAAFQNFGRYFLTLSWPFLSLAIIAYFFLKEKRSLFNKYLLISAVIFIYLIFYYGSWRFDDQLNLSLNNLGASYSRYWLILSVLILPLAGALLNKLGRLKYQISLSCLPWLVFCFLALWSINLTLFKDPNNILSVRQKVATYKIQAAQVINQTEAEAIIITTRTDKWFFPERRVIHSFNPRQDKKLLEVIDKLKSQTPVYIFDVKSGLQKL